jgi:hypothetical protein
LLTEYDYIIRVKGIDNSNTTKEGRKKRMTASARRYFDNWLPVIIHEDGRKETLHGSPLVNKATAKKYAQVAINERLAFRASLNG